MMLEPFLLLQFLVRQTPDHAIWMAAGDFPLAVALVRRLFREKPGPGLNSLLVRKAQTQAIFSLLLSLGAVL